MFPENSGYVVWVASALGPYWGFQQGWMKWLSGVIDNALYPVLFLDYLKSGVPALGGGAPRTGAVLGLTALLTLLNYRGLTVVGWAAICLGVFSLLPFLVMGFISIPKLRPARWLQVDLHNVDWNLYLNTLFWNLNYWDSISTLSGEIRNPGKTLPKALFYAVIFVVVGYLYPLLTGTGAVPLDREQWTDGYFADIAKQLGGAWLMWWMQAAAAMSNMGMFVAEMSSDSYQLLGTAPCRGARAVDAEGGAGEPRRRGCRARAAACAEVRGEEAVAQVLRQLGPPGHRRGPPARRSRRAVGRVGREKNIRRRPQVLNC